jgi:hypothetical protein
MTDTDNPAPSPAITIDAANVIHDAERDSRHGLSHLEDEFLAYWDKMATFSATEAKKLLAWLASKL